eukprot:COSAG05_NODE_288_length_12074_cov_119.196827_9_plen_125_part_00
MIVTLTVERLSACLNARRYSKYSCSCKFGIFHAQNHSHKELPKFGALKAGLVFRLEAVILVRSTVVGPLRVAPHSKHLKLVHRLCPHLSHHDALVASVITKGNNNTLSYNVLTVWRHDSLTGPI